MKMPRTTIKDVKLVQEGDAYYLNLTYECEDEKALYMLNVPRVALPCLNDPYINAGGDNGAAIGFIGGVRLLIHRDMNGALFSKVVIKEKIHKMTVAEIEKKLGYKIEIVSDK